MRHYSKDPRRMEARFEGKCAKCETPIKKGAAIIYWPNGKHVYHAACGEADYQRFLSEAHDEAVMIDGSNPYAR